MLIFQEWLRQQYRKIFTSFVLIVINLCTNSAAGDLSHFRIASYNVQNLFDLKNNGNEYPEYVPGLTSSWNKKVAGKKYENISKVIAEINADIIALQEVESRIALTELLRHLRKRGVRYPFWVIADQTNSVIKCALISKFRITSSSELNSACFRRSILKVIVDVSGKELVIYVNHWPSKKSPESSRLIYASVLKKDVKKLPLNSDYIILGDLNSNYNEFITVKTKTNRRLNDRGGETGINHTLKTTSGPTINDREMIIRRGCTDCLYNLWLEVKPSKRWSYIYKKKKSSLDHIIIPFTLLDRKGIDYVTGSFDTYMPDYVLQRNDIFRWQITKKGHHKGRGFSDHLPVYADFTIEGDRL